MNEHLIFFDGDCNLCTRAVHHLIQLDEEKRLLFAPLEGETAQSILTGPNRHYASADSLVLIESYESDCRAIWIRSQAVFRIYWLLGYYWIGWLSFLPGFLTDGLYRLFAKHRHRIGFGFKLPESSTDRFLK